MGEITTPQFGYCDVAGHVYLGYGFFTRWR